MPGTKQRNKAQRQARTAPGSGGGDHLGGDQLEDPLQRSGLSPTAQVRANKTRKARKLPPLQFEEDPANWTDATCQRLHVRRHGAEWEAMHEAWRDAPKKRWRMVEFRKAYVDGLLRRFRKRYPGLIAKSVGSQNISSDYDVTVATTARDGSDVEAMQAFNDQVKADFGKQPGTVFDTNLYAKDYDQLVGNIPGLTGSDDPIQQPTEMHKTSFVDQDVAALVKIRRYMSATDYDAYVDRIVEGIDSDEEQAAVRKQYEEADAIYQTGVAELLERLEKRFEVSQGLELTEREQAALGAMPQVSAGIVRAQLQNEKRLQKLQHGKGDAVLEAANELYAEKLARIRQIQAQAAALEAVADELASPEQERALQAADALKAQAKKLTGDAIYFAAEAYHSEGSIKHVVAGIQAGKGDANAQKAAFAKLSPGDLLQSFNEQFGDFMKDIGHYGDAHPGKVFYKTSKYAFRLFDAIDLMKGKPGMGQVIGGFEDAQGWTAQGRKAALKSQLLPIRGEEETFASEQQKNQTALARGEAIFGVATVDGYRDAIVDLNVALNAAVRTTISAQVPAEETEQYFKHQV